MLYAADVSQPEATDYLAVSDQMAHSLLNETIKAQAVIAANSRTIAQERARMEQSTQRWLKEATYASATIDAQEKEIADLRAQIAAKQ